MCGNFVTRLVSFATNGLTPGHLMTETCPFCATTAISVSFSQGNAGVDTSCTAGIVEGTKLGFGWLKKLRRLSFFVFAFLSRFALVSKQIFFPQCLFSRFASPTMPQCMQVPQSGHCA
jgi:hypothetical protein